MDYPGFLRMRRSAWDRFEADLAAARRRPRTLTYEQLEALALSYRQILHDHALAGSRFAGTGAARRLARLARDGTRWFYVPARPESGGIHRFWIRSFPLAFRRNLPNLAAVAAVFVVAALFGFFLAIVQTGLASALLPPQALQDLARGRLWTESLVRTIPPMVSSSAIATNNISVSLVGWAGGALAGLGALYIVLFNGFLLGALLGVTLHYALAARLLEFVAAHGPLEITLVLVTASAGLGLGRAFVQAGDRPRTQAVAEAGKDALRVLGGCAPWFVLLAVVESFLSPSPEVSAGVKAATGLALETLFLVAAWNPFLDAEAR